MPLPAQEDTTLDKDYYAGCYMPPGDHIPWTNTTGVTVPAGRVVIYGPYVGITDQELIAGATGTINISDGEVIDTAQVAAGSVFGTLAAECWYDPATGDIQDTSANNLYGIGALVSIMGADGAVGFIKRRYWVREAFYAET